MVQRLPYLRRLLADLASDEFYYQYRKFLQATLLLFDNWFFSSIQNQYFLILPRLQLLLQTLLYTLTHKSINYSPLLLQEFQVPEISKIPFHQILLLFQIFYTNFVVQVLFFEY